jgi:hypothetical protein
LFGLLGLTIAVGAIVYPMLEGWTVLEAIYFCFVTLATVGYGDITPKTAPGRLFTIFYIVVGIGLVAGFANTVARRWVERRLSHLGSRPERFSRTLEHRAVPVRMRRPIARRARAGRPRPNVPSQPSNVK